MFKVSNISLICLSLASRSSLMNLNHSLLAVGVTVGTGGVSMVLSGGGGGGDLVSIGVASLKVVVILC